MHLEHFEIIKKMLCSSDDKNLKLFTINLKNIAIKFF